MKLKNTFTLFVTFLFLISLYSVSAVMDNPLPINGRLIGSNVEGFEIQAKNTRTGITMSAFSNGAGEYMVEWANSFDPVTSSKYTKGDVFVVHIVGCVKPECSHSVTYLGQPEIFMTFDLNDVFICPPRQCPDCGDCPESESDWLAWILGSGIAVLLGLVGYLGKKRFTPEEEQKLEDKLAEELSVGSGLRAYKHTDGIVRMKHLHYGRIGYHDIQIRHRNNKHERGDLLV